MRFGVQTGHRYEQPAEMNIHGRRIKSVGLPSVTEVPTRGDESWSSENLWWVIADVDRDPELQLALTTRTSIVENEFAERLRGAARKAIYRAMSRRTHPQAAARDARRAAAAGIVLPPARPMLQPCPPYIEIRCSPIPSEMVRKWLNNR